jgi:hypothetical protein
MSVTRQLPITPQAISMRRAVPFAGLAAIVGVVVIAASLAAGPLAAFEAESGALTGNAKLAAVSGSSGSSVVQFSTGITPSTTPPSTAKPVASNTGVPAGVTLTAYTGPSDITVNGTVIDGKDIHTRIFIDANNVTIKNSRITDPQGNSSGTVLGVGESWNTTSRQDTTGTVLSHLQVIGSGRGGCDIVVGGINYTADALDVSGCEDGMHSAANTIITNTYIHDNSSAAGGHVDCFQLYTGSTGGHGITLDHINCEGTITNSAAGFDKTVQTDGHIHGFVIKNSWLAGGSQYLNISCEASSGLACTGPNPYLTITNNKIYPSSPGSNSGPAFFNAWPGNINYASCSGNTWADTGELIFGTGGCS